MAHNKWPSLASVRGSVRLGPRHQDAILRRQRSLPRERGCSVEDAHSDESNGRKADARRLGGVERETQ